MAKEKKLEDLFHDTLKDIYYAERKILKALPKMARAAQSPDLKGTFEKHRDETRRSPSTGIRTDGKAPARQDLRSNRRHHI